MGDEIHEYEWMKDLTERDRQELTYAGLVRDTHGPNSGNARLQLIVRLADKLDKAEGAIVIEYKTIMQYLKDPQHPFLWEKKDKELDEIANKEQWRVVAISHVSEKQRFVMVVRETPDEVDVQRDTAEEAVMEPTYQERLEALPWNVDDEPELNNLGQIIQEIMGTHSPYEAFLRDIVLSAMADANDTP